MAARTETSFAQVQKSRRRAHTKIEKQRNHHQSGQWGFCNIGPMAEDYYGPGRFGGVAELGGQIFLPINGIQQRFLLISGETYYEVSANPSISR